MAAVLIFNQVDWFWLKTTLDKLVTMATKKHLSLIYKIENFANTYLRTVTKFQACSVLEFWAIYWAGGGKQPPPPPPPAVTIGLSVRTG